MESSNGKGALEQLVADKLVADQAALPGGTPAPAKIDEADRLAVENIFLKLQYLKSQVELCDSQKMLLEMQKKDVGQQMLQLQDQLNKLRSGLSAKYGMTIDATSVSADGTIRHKPAPSPRPTTGVSVALADGTAGYVAADVELAPAGSVTKVS
jgi:hypothetical protein